METEGPRGDRGGGPGHRRSASARARPRKLRIVALLAAAALVVLGGLILRPGPVRPPGTGDAPRGTSAGEPEPVVALEPDSIRFPDLHGPDKEKLDEARRLHGDALGLYRSGDRSGGDERAQRALSLYREAGAMVPELAGLHYEILVSRIGDGRYQETILRAKEWLERFPDDTLHRETLAKALFQSGRYRECVEELQRLLRSHPGEVRFLRMQVSALLMEGSRDEALTTLAIFLKAAGIEPVPAPGDPPLEGEIENVRIAARTLLRFQEHQRAIPYLERLRRLAPADATVRFDLATALRAVGRCRDALALLEPLASDPDLGGDALVEAALCHSKENRPREAAVALCQALERDPTHSQGYRQLAQALRRLGKEAEARTMDDAASSLTRSLRERSRSAEHRAAGKAADAAYSQALSLALAGRFREADAVLASPKLRRNPVLAFHRATLYLGWLRGKEAADLAEGLLQARSVPRSEAARLLAQAQDLQGLHEEALRTLRGVLADEPGNEGLRSDLTRLEKGPEIPTEPTQWELLELRKRVARTPWPDASPLLATTARGLERYDRSQAVQLARLACAADPSLPEAWRVLGRLLVEPAELFYRLEAWKSLLALAPGDEEARREAESCRKEVERLSR